MRNAVNGFVNYIIFALCLNATCAYAANGIATEQLEFRVWSESRPNSVTVISGVMSGNAPLWGPPMWAGVTWVDQKGNQPRRHLEVLCRLNKGSKLPCGVTDSAHHHRIEEVYIGSPDALTLQGGVKTKLHARLTMADLEALPPNVKRVILVNVWGVGWLRQALTAVFDDAVTDDELRTLVLEDGIYRAYGWRED